MSSDETTERRSDKEAERSGGQPPSAPARRWEIHFELTRAEWSQALNRYWSRAWRHTVIIRLCLLIPVVLLTCVGGFDVAAAILWAVLGVTWLQYISAYVHYRSHSMKWLRDAEDLTLSYTFSDDGVAVSSERASSQVKWRTLDKLWRYPDMWLLVIQRTQFFVLPTRSMPEDLQAAIERWMRLGAGGHPRCARCGYDVRGQEVPRCPECGTPFEEDVLKIRQ